MRWAAILLLTFSGCNGGIPGTQDEKRGDAVRRIESLAEQYAVIEHLNLFITYDIDGALTRARELDASNVKPGRLHGVPIAVKDNIHVAGLPNTAGTSALSGFTPAIDNPAIACLLEAGVIVIGKTNMHELAFGVTSNNALFGAVGNPHNASYFAGGSSGGTAAAIAAGIVPMGLGTDTGGSVRIPAALNGIVGFRPSTGRYPMTDVTPISSTRDIIGPMALNVADVMLLDEAMRCDVEIDTTSSIDLNKVRLGVPRAWFYDNLDSATQARMEAALDTLSVAGVTLVKVDLADVGSLLAQTAFPIALFEAKRDLTAYLGEFLPGLSFEALVNGVVSPDVRGVLSSLLEGGIPQADYDAALAVREIFRGAYADYFTQHLLDAIVFPTTPLPARPIEGSDETVMLNDELVPTFLTYIRNTEIATIVNAPALTLPIGAGADGLPVGLEIDGLEGQDRNLLRLGLALERVLSK